MPGNENYFPNITDARYRYGNRLGDLGRFERSHEFADLSLFRKTVIG